MGFSNIIGSTMTGLKNAAAKWPRLTAACALAFQLGLLCPQAQATKADSGWVPLFNGKDFSDGFYVYSNGYLPIAGQTKFKVENGMIHAGGPYALLITTKEYSFYKIRVDYKFGAGVGGGGNAGMMIEVDNQAAKTATALRPRSIEINCRRDNGYPWTLWASSGLGPIMATTVKKGTAQYQTAADGGVAYTVDPSGNRTLESIYPNPELAVGQWNHGEASVYGDSGVFYLNGKLRTASWHWTQNAGGKNVRVAGGGVGVQTEGFDIWYQNWEIQELDSASLLPIHARRGCTDAASPKFDSHAVIGDGSCAASTLADKPHGWLPGLATADRRVDGKRVPAHSAAAMGARQPLFVSPSPGASR